MFSTVAGAEEELSIYLIIHKNRTKIYVDISHNFMIKKINKKAKIQKIYTVKYVTFIK